MTSQSRLQPTTSKRKMAKESFTKEQIEEYRAAFNMFVRDTDEEKHDNRKGKKRTSGLSESNSENVITLDKLGIIMKSLFQSPTSQELQEMIREADEDGNGEIDFEEFLMLVSSRNVEVDSALEMQEAFRIFDQQGTGSINADQIQNVFHSVGHVHLTLQECQNMIDEFGTKGGTLQFDNFCDLMSASVSKRSSRNDRHALHRLKRRQQSQKQLPMINEEEISPEDIDQLFDMFDINKNNKIGKEEMRTAFQSVGEQISDEELQYLMEQIGLSHSGVLDKEDFLALFHGKKKQPVSFEYKE